MQHVAPAHPTSALLTSRSPLGIDMLTGPVPPFANRSAAAGGVAPDDLSPEAMDALLGAPAPIERTADEMERDLTGMGLVTGAVPPILSHTSPLGEFRADDAFAPPPDIGVGERVSDAGRAFAREGATTFAKVPAGYALYMTQEGDLARAALDFIDETEKRPRDYFRRRLVLAPFVNEYFGSTKERRAEMRQELESMTPRDPRDNDLYQATNRAVASLARTFPANPALRDSLLTRGAGIAGETVGFGALAVASGPFAPVTVGGTAGAAGSVDQFETALDSGANLETALKAASLGRLIGLPEFVPVVKVLKGLDTVTGGGVRNIVTNALKQGSVEAAQEAAQAILNNLAARGLYDRDRDILFDADGAAVTGFSAGALFQFALEAVAGGRRGRARLAQRNQTRFEAPLEQTVPAPTPGIRSLLEMEAELQAADSAAVVPSRDVRVPFISEADNLNRGREAVDLVLRTQGSVPAAMIHPDVGPITFDFGTPGDPEKLFRKGSGLIHILAKRNSEGIDGERFVREELPEIIAKGRLSRLYGPSNNRRADIVFRNKRVVFVLARQGNRETWVLTGFDENVEPR